MRVRVRVRVQVRLLGPLLVEQPGEAVEDAHVLGRHRPLLVDPLPVVSDAVCVVDGRVPLEPARHLVRVRVRVRARVRVRLRVRVRVRGVGMRRRLRRDDEVDHEHAAYRVLGGALGERRGRRT